MYRGRAALRSGLRLALLPSAGQRGRERRRRQALRLSDLWGLLRLQSRWSESALLPAGPGRSLCITCQRPEQPRLLVMADFLQSEEERALCAVNLMQDQPLAQPVSGSCSMGHAEWMCSNYVEFSHLSAAILMRRTGPVA